MWSRFRCLANGLHARAVGDGCVGGVYIYSHRPPPPPASGTCSWGVDHPPLSRRHLVVGGRDPLPQHMAPSHGGFAPVVHESPSTARQRMHPCNRVEYSEGYIRSSLANKLNHAHHGPGTFTLSIVTFVRQTSPCSLFGTTDYSTSLGYKRRRAATPCYRNWHSHQMRRQRQAVVR